MLLTTKRVLLCLSLLIIYFVWLEKTSYDFFTPSNISPAPLFSGVMTYNIQYLPWKKKTLTTLRQQTRDYPIIMCQEMFNQLGSLPLPAAFPDYYIARGKMTGLRLVNSGLVTLSKYPILSYEFFRFQAVTPYTPEILSDRGFLACVIQLPTGNVCFINLHLQSCDHADYDPTVKSQLREVFQYTRTLNMPYVIGGDFNIDYRQLNPELYAPARVLAPSNPTIYINLETADTSTVPKPDYKPYVFDYFLLHPDVSATSIFSEQNDYSDHNPSFLLF